MSEENVELVRRGVKAFVAGDFEAWFESFDPEVVWEETSGLGPDAAGYRGVEEVRQAVESWMGMWTDYVFEAREYIDAGDDQVLVLAYEHGRSRSAGVSVKREIGELFDIDDGKLIRARLYGSWAEAREAAGLSE